MRQRFARDFLIVIGFVTAAGVLAQGQYTKIGEIPIGGAATFDYLNVDSGAKRLYVTHGTEVVVIDTAAGTVVGRIQAGPRIHGIALVGDRGYITNGGDATLSIVDLKTLQVLNKVTTDPNNPQANPDAITYEPKQKEIYAFNHTGKSAAALDAATGKLNALIPLSGIAEAGQADPALGRVYVNIEDTNSVDVIDVASHKVIATWPVAPATSPTGMAIDLAAHRIFVGGGPNTVMLDGQSGKVIASLPICAGTDATWFDPATKTVFSSCGGGNGAVTIGRVNGDTMTVVQTVETVRGARTMAFDPATRRIYVVGQKYAAPDPNAPPPPPPAAGQRGRGGPPAIPDSFHVLVLGMK
jgi:DNA-binding beta-propeller fold protein YncE